MRKEILLSELMEKIGKFNKPIIGFKIAHGKIEPIEDLSTRLPNEALIILPKQIKGVPNSLKEIAHIVDMLDTYLHIYMDITLAGYVYMLYDPLFKADVIKKPKIEINTHGEDPNAHGEDLHIEFIDNSKIKGLDKESLHKLLERIDMNVLKSVNTDI